jgi:hypothetical protein
MGGVHPHIRTVSGARHAVLLFDEYHKKAPVFLVQSDTRPIGEFSEASIKQARTLYDACEVFGIVPKTVGDIAAIRRDTPLAVPHIHKFPGALWLLPPLPANFRCAYIWGGSGLGKTQYALSHGSPLRVTTMDDIRKFNPLIHDVIVFDDIDFKPVIRSVLLQCIDWDENSSVDLRYTPAMIPKHTKKIFISNLPFKDNMLKLISDDQDVAIRRRFSHIVHVTGPTWDARGPIFGPELPPQAMEVVEDDIPAEGVHAAGVIANGIEADLPGQFADHFVPGVPNGMGIGPLDQVDDNQPIDNLHGLVDLDMDLFED